ncbi:MAG: Asp23/Gls24 family envelope stress response protein [Anaerolineae bacterium]
MEGQKLGTVTIAPEVLRTIARLTTLATPGVAGLSYSFRGMNRLLRRPRISEGIKIDIEDDAVAVDLHIIVEPHTNMLRLGQQLQAEVNRAIHDMVGMTVREVNVHIEDVADFASE